MVADFRSAGAINSGTTNFSGLSAPAGVLAGDILLSEIETDGATTLNPPGTWQNVPGTPITTTNGSASRLHLWWRRAASDGDNTPPNIGTVAGLDHFVHRCIAIKECPVGSDPIDVVATQIDTTIDTTTRLPGITTTEDNCLIVHAMAMGSAQASNNTTRYTSLTAPSGITAHAKRIDNGRIDGNDGCIGMWTGRRLTSGAMVSTTGVCADSDSKLGVTIAFKTAPADELPLDLLQQGSSTVDGTAFVSNGSMFGGTDSVVWAGILGTGTSIGVPTLAGLGRTWTLEQDISINATVRLFVFKGEGETPTGGTVTITFPATATGCNWGFMRQRGGSGDVVQSPEISVTNSINTTLTWAAAADAANKQILFGAVSLQSTNNTVTPESPWVEAVENVRASPAAKLVVWTNPGTFDTSTTLQDDGTTYDFAIIGLELDYAAGGGSPQSQEIARLTAASSQRTIARTPGVVARTTPRLTAAGTTRTLARTAGMTSRIAPRLVAAGQLRTIARTTAISKTIPRLTSVGVIRTIARSSAIARILSRLVMISATRTIARSSVATRPVPKLSAAGLLRLFGRTTVVARTIPRQTGVGTVRTFDLDTAVSRTLARLAGGSTLRGLATVPGVVGRPIPRQIGVGAIRAFGIESSGASTREIPRIVASLEGRDFATSPGGVARTLSRGLIIVVGRGFASGISGQTRELPKLLAAGSIRSLSRSPGEATRTLTRGLLVMDSNGLTRQAGPISQVVPRLLWPVTIHIIFVTDSGPDTPAIYEIIGPYGNDESIGPDVDDGEILGPVDRSHALIGPYGTIYAIHIIGPKGGNDA